MQPGAFERTMSPKAATLFCWWMWKPCKVNWTNPTLFWTGEATSSPESAAVASTLKHKHALVQSMLLSISWSSGMDVWLLALSCATWTSTTSKCSQPWWSMRRHSTIAWKLKFHRCKATEDPRLRSWLWNRKWMRWKRSWNGFHQRPNWQMVLPKLQHGNCLQTAYGPTSFPCTPTRASKQPRRKLLLNAKLQPDAMRLVVCRKALVLQCWQINLSQYEVMILQKILFHPTTSFSSSPSSPCLWRQFFWHGSV